jgi:transposase
MNWKKAGVVGKLGEINPEVPTTMQARIRIGKETVKELVAGLQKAYKSGDVKMVRRVSTLLDVSRADGIEVAAQTHGVSRSSVYAWLKQLMVEGVASLKPKWKGGRPSKLTKTQKKRLYDLVKAGPGAAGFPSACWNAAMIQEMILKAFGVLYNVHYVAELLKNLGFSFQKARFVSDHLDEAKRLAWLTQIWPLFRDRAQAAGAMLLFGDESSFAQWGSLSYTWAPVGEQPVIPTSGKRKGFKVFGMIEFFSGRLFYQGISERFNADTYIAFLTQILRQTYVPLFLVQDNASYHKAKKVKKFFKQHADRLRVTNLPSYSPDYNPIEFLWRSIKRRATHNRYFSDFSALTASVEEALLYFSAHPEEVKSLFTFYLNRMAEPLASVA